jgi:transcriptional regulator with XRE-family HTH domain
MKMGNNFRENLRSELNYQGVTVKELSTRTCISIATLDCYLGARATVPSVDAAFKIAQALQVSMEYLVIGDKTDKTPIQKRISHEARDIIRWVENLNLEQCRAIHNIISVLTNKKSFL